MISSLADLRPDMPEMICAARKKQICGGFPRSGVMAIIGAIARGLPCMKPVK
jgi:hypothetical protein